MLRNRTLALLLTLLLAVSCTTPALATLEDGFLDQFEITVPELPTASNTLADVLGTPSPTGSPASVTYNGGEAVMYFYPEAELQIRNPDGMKMKSSDGFKEGAKYFFYFATKLPAGMDIQNSLISVNSNGDIVVDLPVFINGTQCEESVIYYRADAEEDVISVNAYYTVPVGQTPSGDVLKEISVDGLILPYDGLKVADSYANATAYVNTKEDVREIKSVLWWEFTPDRHMIKLTDEDSFEAGKEYQVEISIEKKDEFTNIQSDPGIAYTWIVAVGYINGEKVYTGSGDDTADLSIFDGYIIFANQYVCAESGQTAGEMLKEIYIDGLALPADDMTAYQSMTSCEVKGLTVTSMVWYEVTPEGNLIKMVNTDRFKAGTEYHFKITVDAEEYEVDHRTTAAPSSWVVADVYLNGELVYNGLDFWGPEAHLDFYMSGMFSERELNFSFDWTADAAAGPSDNPFTDVAQEDYYYDAVLWAFNHDPQITDGMTDTAFGPDLTVTRGQCVTFLWRAMGRPEPASDKNPFTDVPADQYYYKAVQWAVEKGITDGMTDTTFEPGTTLSTAHIITFLYRTLGIGANGWYQEAAEWAAKENLLDKMGLTVDPGVNCPRGSVVTFLYRELK